MKIQLDLYAWSFGTAGAFVAYAAAFWLLNRRYGLLDSLRSLLNRYAPLFFIVAPPVITYGFINGFISFSFGLGFDHFFAHEITDRESFYLPIFKSFEFLSGIGMGYIWLRVAKWVGLQPIWYLFILMSHFLVAGYRTTRSDFGGQYFGSTVSEHFMIMEGLVPLLAFPIFAAIHLRKKGPNHARDATE